MTPRLARYEPLFPYFADLAKTDGCFVVMTDDYVTDDSGIPAPLHTHTRLHT